VRTSGNRSLTIIFAAGASPEFTISISNVKCSLKLASSGSTDFFIERSATATASGSGAAGDSGVGVSATVSGGVEAPSWLKDIESNC